MTRHDDGAIALALHREQLRRIILIGFQRDVDEWRRERRALADPRIRVDVVTATDGRDLDRLRGIDVRAAGLVVLTGRPGGSVADTVEARHAVASLRSAGARMLPPTWPEPTRYVVYRAASGVAAVDLPPLLVGQWAARPDAGGEPDAPREVISQPTGRHERHPTRDDWAEVYEVRPRPAPTSPRRPPAGDTAGGGHEAMSAW